MAPKGERVLVTCALPYVNNVPHIGNIVGSHLPADIFARFCRLAGHETLFVGGSDEHGTPIEVAAQRLGVGPKELCDRYYEVHKGIYDWLEISYDNFSRTSLEGHHATTNEFFLRIHERGFVSEGTIRLPFCTRCTRALPDRYVEGICPRCGYDGARGDQCERCSTLLDPEELKEPRCAICGSRPEMRDKRHLFLNLDKLSGPLAQWIEGKKGVWSPHVIALALGWITEGLKPRCITRDIKWGVKVPLPGYEGTVFYVWFDAPIGYISSTKEWAQKAGRDEAWRDYWHGGAKIFHFIGKDNIPFHTIFWPGMLLANGSYELPYRVVGLQYLNYEGGKISKSRGWGVFCENLPRAGISPEVWRFYLSMLIPEANDTEWKWKEFQERVNNELVANLGNFIYRTLSFIQKNFDGVVPSATLTEEDLEVFSAGKRCAEEYKTLLWDVRLRDGLRKVLELSDTGNRYFQGREPWKAIKTDREGAAATLHVCANLCYDLAILMAPYLPASASRVCEQLGVAMGDLGDVGVGRVKGGERLKEPRPLFPKLDDEAVERLKKATGRVTRYEEMFLQEVDPKEFSRLELRVGRVVKAERDGRYLGLEVEVGGKIKKVMAPLGEAYAPEELVGKPVVLLENLELEVGGRKSEGLLLSIQEKALVTLDREVGSGGKVR